MKKTILIVCFFITTMMGIAQVTVTTLAGSTQGFANGIGGAAQFSGVYGVATDAVGNVYVSDSNNNKIRKITPEGVVTTFAGSTAGSADGIGVGAQFSGPMGLAIDLLGNIYVADVFNNTIRKITPAGNVSTLAGSPISAGFADGIGADARFNFLHGVATDTFGNVYVGDTGNHKIRKITPAGLVSTFAGSIQGFANGIGVNAKFDSPFGIGTDSANNVFVADSSNHKIRKITPNGEVSTYAGTSVGFMDDTALLAQFNYPNGVATDAFGNVFVADQFNNKIRKITPIGVVSTLAGTNEGFADGTQSEAQFYYPSEVAADAFGNIFVADLFNHKIRKITQTLGVVQNKESTKILVFPNPVTSVLNLQLEKEFIIDKIIITDFLGKTILSQTQNTESVNVANLAKGIYILEVFSGTEKIVSKFLKE